MAKKKNLIPFFQTIISDNFIPDAYIIFQKSDYNLKIMHMLKFDLGSTSAVPVCSMKKSEEREKMKELRSAFHIPSLGNEPIMGGAT